MQRIAYVIIGLLLLAGCRHFHGQARRAENTLPDDPRLGSLDRAEVLRKQGEHIDATIEYRKVIECSQDPWEQQAARIGAAKALIKTHRYAAAMAALGPLPVVVQSEYERRTLAIAGEILLRQHRAEEAETCLELALDSCSLEVFLAKTKSNSLQQSPGDAGQTMLANFDNSLSPEHGELFEPPSPNMDGAHHLLTPHHANPHHTGALGSPLQAGNPTSVGGVVLPSWLAGACANLGNAYLKNDKPEKAAVMYRFAADVSRQNGKHIAAQRAQRIHDQLASTLRQYAPYKPHPVVQGFPSGKY